MKRKEGQKEETQKNNYTEDFFYLQEQENSKNLGIHCLTDSALQRKQAEVLKKRAKWQLTQLVAGQLKPS